MTLTSAALTAFLPALDVERTVAFLTSLGLTVTDANPFATVVASGPVPIRVTKVEAFTPQPFTVLGWEVPSLDAVLDDLRAAGVVPLRYDGMVQDERGVWTAPGGARIVWFHDPDRNVLSVTELG